MAADFQSRSLNGNSHVPQRRVVQQQQRSEPRYQPHRSQRPGNGWKEKIRMKIAQVIAFYRSGSRWQQIFKVGGTMLGIGILYIGFLWATLPDIRDTLFASQSTVITDRNGVELYRLFNEEDRTFAPKEKITDDIEKAIVAIEDERFYERGCLDLRALGRVVFTMGRTGGASTLTRQLARNALDLQNDNIINRKMKELILGCLLESRYSREDLLNLYLNWIPFGQNAYGVEQASQTYYGVSAETLTLAQSAVLAALPQRPSYFSPYGNHLRTDLDEEVKQDIREGTIASREQIRDENITIGLLGATFGSGSNAIYVGGRTDQVLKNMLDLKFITDEQQQQALKDTQTMTFKKSRENIRAPHFVLWVKQQVENMFDSSAEEGVIEQGGLNITTTLDWELQQIAEQIVADRKDDIARLYGAHNISLVAVDPKTGEVLAYVGNADYNDEEHDGKVDMARAARQPGSSFKPIVYAGAFKQGYNPATVLFDVPTKIGDYEPQNFDGKFSGLMNIRQALGASRNIPAIKAYFLAGEEDSLLDFAEQLGMPTPKELKPAEGYGPSMAIGSAEAPLTEMVQAYATLADGGVRRPMIPVVKITDRNGNFIPCPICAQGDGSAAEEQVLDPRVAYQVTSILSDGSVRPGDFWRNALTVPGTAAAAKTGTSNKCLKTDDKKNCIERKPLDLLTMGYTPSLVVGVWAGNADSSALSDKADGLNVAAPIWKQFLTKAQALKKGPTTFDVPDGMIQPLVSVLSGELPTECTPIEARKSDFFLREEAPSKNDPACVQLLVDKVTGLLASDACPAEAAEMQSFFKPYHVLSDRWPQWLTAVNTWAASQQSTTGSTLPLKLAPTEECDVTLTPGRLEKPEVDIVSPGIDYATYPTFRVTLDTTVGSSIKEIRYEIDGKEVSRETEAPFTNLVRVPSSVNRSGKHTLKVTIVDRYFNEATDEVTFGFGEDINGPGIRLIEPDDDITMEEGSSIRIAAEAEDRENGIKHVQLFLNDQLITTKPRAPFETTYTLTQSPGNYTIRAVATDFSDNTSTDVVRLTITQKAAASASSAEAAE